MSATGRNDGHRSDRIRLVEKMNVTHGMADTFEALHPQLQSIDFRRDVSVLEVPVYLVQGAYEMGPCAQLVPEWFDALSIGPLPHRR